MRSNQDLGKIRTLQEAVLPRYMLVLLQILFPVAGVTEDRPKSKQGSHGANVNGAFK